MPFLHLILVLLVVIIWGINFLFVKFALEEISPLFLCALRFFLASVPVIFFIKPPAAPLRVVLSYGLITFALQFSLFFIGMHAGMTPGMAALITQTQVFFAMFFAATLLGEKASRWQIMGALTSFVGIGLVTKHLDQSITFLGFICILAAAASWGLGTLITKKNNRVSMISLVVWGSFVGCLPISLLSLIFEGPQTIANDLYHLNWQTVLSIAYIVYISTWVGYGVWNWLISLYPVSTIVPFTLLVPVVGIFSSSLVLGETFETWKLVAGILVIGGLIINLFGDRLYRMLLREETIS